MTLLSSLLSFLFLNGPQGRKESRFDWGRAARQKLDATIHRAKFRPDALLRQVVDKVQARGEGCGTDWASPSISNKFAYNSALAMGHALMLGKGPAATEGLMRAHFALKGACAKLRRPLLFGSAWVITTGEVLCYDLSPLLRKGPRDFPILGGIHRRRGK